MSKILLRITKSFIKKFLFIFHNNPFLLQLLNATLYDYKKNVQIFLKHDSGYKYIVHSNDIVSKNFFIGGESDFKILKKGISILKKNTPLETLIFVGANIGVVPIESIKKNLFKKAILFEAYKKNFNILISNIYINNLDETVEAYHAAIGDKKKFLFMKKAGIGNLGDVRGFESKKYTKNDSIVSCNTLDFYLSNETINKNSLLFIDVQGYEPYVLHGARDIIKKKIPIILEFDPALMPRDYLFYFKPLFSNYRFFYDLNEDSIEKKS